jgi:hypothetical protein
VSKQILSLLSVLHQTYPRVTEHILQSGSDITFRRVTNGNISEAALKDQGIPGKWNTGEMPVVTGDFKYVTSFTLEK